MRLVALAVAALLLAAPAWGATYSVPSPTSLATALASATDGDTVLVAAGSHASLSPADAGVGPEPIVFVGSGSCTVADIVPKSHTRFYGFTVTAGVDLPDNGKRVVINGCTLGSLNMKDADSSSVRNCTIGGTQLRVAVQITGGSNADADTLEGCTFTALDASGSEPAVFMGYNAGGIGDADTDSCRYFVQRFNVFNISQSGSTSSTFVKHFECPNFYSYGNKYVLTSTTTAAGDEGNYCVLFRDACYNGVMRRDTIYVNNESSNQSHQGLMFASGMAGNDKSNHHFAVDSCYVRVFRGNAVYLQTMMPSLLMRYNVLRSRLGTALDVASGFNNTADDPRLHHNTLMGVQAIRHGDYANTGGGLFNNIFWGTSSASCAVGTAVSGSNNATNSNMSDSNFVYSTTGDSTRAFYYTSACQSPRTSTWAGLGNDTHSYWGSPAFTDTTWASLNVKPATGSLAISSNLWTLGYAGASDGTGEAPPPPAATILYCPSCLDDDDWYYIRREDQ